MAIFELHTTAELMRNLHVYRASKCFIDANISVKYVICKFIWLDDIDVCIITGLIVHMYVL